MKLGILYLISHYFRRQKIKEQIERLRYEIEIINSDDEIYAEAKAQVTYNLLKKIRELESKINIREN